MKKLAHYLSLILLVLTATQSMKAYALTNTALVCYTVNATTGGAAVALPVSGTCPNPSWHTPAKGQAVLTQANTWVAFDPLSPIPIEICSATSIGAGNIATACPSGSVTYQLPCKALGQTCGTAPPPNPNSFAVLSWIAPTLDVAGYALTVPLTYNVYRGTSATSLSKLTNVTGLTYTDPAGSAVPTTYTYAVTATCGSCSESALSATVTITLASGGVIPAAPASLTVH